MRNKSLCLLLLTFSLLIIHSCSESSQVFEDSVCFTNVNTIDAQDGLKSNMTVVIKGNKIIKSVPSSSLNLSSKNKIIEAKGKFMVPGLWDAHVHFAYMESLAPSMFKLFLMYGITSVRDTGGEIGFIKAWKDKSVANPRSAPRVKIAGPLIDGLPNVYDGSAPTRPPLSVGVGTVEEAIEYVNYLDSIGVDLIKAYEMLTPEQFKAVTKRAKELGLKVTGHIPLSMDAIEASDAGMNSMEHFRNIEMSCAEDWEDLKAQRVNLLDEGKNDPGGILRSRLHNAQRIRAVETQSEENTEKVLNAFLRNDTWQIPTLTLFTGSSVREFAESEYQESFKYLPSEVETSWKESINDFIATPPTEAMFTYSGFAEKMVDRMNKKGINFMAGTDCPIFFLTPGHSLHIELQRYVEFGMTPLEALATATSQPAKYFGMQDSLGYIKEGMIADLLILDSNPLEDIKNTLQLNTLIKDGKVYNPSDLVEMRSSLDN